MDNMDIKENRKFETDYNHPKITIINWIRFLACACANRFLIMSKLIESKICALAVKMARGGTPNEFRK